MTLPESLRFSRKDWLPLAALLAAVLIVFWNVPRGFYQQDEWQILGNNFAQGWGDITHYSSPMELLLAGGRPLIRLVDLLFFGYFKYTVFPIGIAAVATHFLAVGLTYVLGRRLSGSRTVAFVAALFFAVNAVSQSAVSWVAAYGTVAATVLILLSVLAYLEFLRTQRLRLLVLTGLLIYVSMMFKEIGVFLVILYPLLYLLETKKLTWRKFVRGNSVFLAAGLLAVFFRLGEFFFASTKMAGLAAGGGDFAPKVAVRLLLYPLTSLFQPLVPSEPMMGFARWFSELQYPYLKTASVGQLVSETVTTDMLSLLGTLVLIGVAVALWRRARKASEPHLHLTFALLFGLLSLMPYALVDRGSSYLDSRYYYLTSIAVGLILGAVFEWLYRKAVWAKALALLALVPLLWTHISLTRQAVDRQVVLGDQVQGILEVIRQSVPTFSGQAIFYIGGDRSYFVENNHIPFQQGVGNTLLIRYYREGPVPKSYLNDNVMWDLGDQGYLQRPGLSFGYYADLGKLKADQVKYGFPTKAVHAFYWDSAQSRLRDITPEIRQQLAP